MCPVTTIMNEFSTKVMMKASKTDAVNSIKVMYTSIRGGQLLF